MRLKGRSQRYLAVLSVCCGVYFWGTWTLHSLLDDASARDVKDGTPKLPSKLLAPDEPGQVMRASAQKVRDGKAKKVKDGKPKQVKNGKAKPATVERPTPPPPDGNFSACLLIMDDNHFLIEWLVSSTSCVSYTLLAPILSVLISLFLNMSFASEFSLFHFTGLSLSYASSEASHRFCRSSKQNFSYAHFGSMEKTRNGYRSVGG
jgi:hypothetical protein